MSSENIATFLSAVEQDPSLLDNDIRLRQFSIKDKNLDYSTDARLMLADTLIDKARNTLRDIREQSDTLSEKDYTLIDKAYAGIIIGITTRILIEMLHAKDNKFGTKKLCVWYGDKISGLGLPQIMPSELVSRTSADPIRIEDGDECMNEQKVERLEKYYQKHHMIDLFAMEDNLPATLRMFLRHTSFTGTNIMKEVKMMLPLYEKLSKHVSGDSEPVRRSQPAKAEAPQWLTSVLDGIDFGNL